MNSNPKLFLRHLQNMADLTMPLDTRFLVWIIVIIISGCNYTPSNKKTLEEKKEDKIRIKLIEKGLENKVEVWIDGTLFTQYMYPEGVKKPILYPLKTASGILVTRGWPLSPRPFERFDHPHQVGMWLTHGDVNSLDFWGHSDSIQENRRSSFGTVHHKSIKKVLSGEEEGKLITTSEWKRQDGRILLLEKTEFTFTGTDSTRVVDRHTILEAQRSSVRFQDTKEGMMGIRVARELEQPPTNDIKVFDSDLKPTVIPAGNDTISVARYRSSEGLEGDAVWGTRAKWVKLSSIMNDEPVAIIVMDHPENPNYPTHWHARGYGLFSANAFGSRMFTNNREELNFFLAAGESVTFNYRIIIHNGSELPDETINTMYFNFAGAIDNDD